MNAPSYPTASQTLLKGLYFFAFQVALLPDPRVCKPCSSPASGNAPLGKKGSREQAASFQRPPRRPVPVVLLSLDWARNAPYSLDKVRVREGAVGPSFSQTATSRVPGYGGETCRTTKSKDKGKRRHPEENRQRDNLQITKLGDDQERRAKWQKTQGRELLASTKKTQWMRTARKVQQRKPVPPMRKNRPEQKNTKKTETASKTGANEKTYP